jgi:hypothetical protein
MPIIAAKETATIIQRFRDIAEGYCMQATGAVMYAVRLARDSGRRGIRGERLI